MAKAKKGIYAAALTSMDRSGEPDAHKLVAFCRGNIEQGLDGVAPLGTTGEGNSLPLAMRRALPDVFVDAGFASNEVIFGTGS